MRTLILLILLFPILIFAQTRATWQGPHLGGAFNDSVIVGIHEWVDPQGILDWEDIYSAYATDSTSDYLIVDNFNFRIPTDATIDGIEVSVHVYSSDRWPETGIPDLYSVTWKIQLVKEDGSIVAENKAVDTAYYGGLSPALFVYGDSTDLWGETWTPANINDNQFGVAYAIRNNCVLGYCPTTFANYILVTVYYTAQQGIKKNKFIGIPY